MWHSATRDLAVVLGASWLARLVFVAAVGDAHSLDVDYWQGALSAQDEGTNPYETGVLNWPPFWLQVIVGIDYTAGVLGLSFLSVLRIYLVLVESALVVVLYLLLVSLGAARGAVGRALLVGIALNPVAVILVCQHGNSDVQVGLLVTLAVAALAAYERTRDVVFWLCGCLLLGLGVLAKTAPLVLAPVLAPGARLSSRTGRALGAALFLGPAALGVSVLLALSPTATLDHVIGYRSTRGFFGLSGMVGELADVDLRLTYATAIAAAAFAALVWAWRRLSRAGAPSPDRVFLLAAGGAIVLVLWLAEAFDRFTSLGVRDRYDTLFTLGMLVLVAWLGYRLWREPPLTAARLFLLVAVVFLAVVAFGPGYGAHYAYWFLPALVATYVLLDDAWRRLLLVAYAVAAVTYAIEYAFVSFLGAYAVAIFGADDWILDVAEELEKPEVLVIGRLPIFALYLLVIAAGIARLADSTERARPTYEAKL